MGRKGKFFSAVKKAFSPESKEKKIQKNYKSTNNLGDIGQIQASVHSYSESSENGVRNLTPANDSQLQIVRNEQSKSISYEASASETVADTGISHFDTSNSRKLALFAGKSDEEVAAIKIQTAFRGYLARRALKALRGIVRLKSLIHGNTCRRQTSTTLRCMQTLSRVQSQIRSRRIIMQEENLALQRQLLLKREKELEILKMGDQWDDSTQSKEQIESNLLSKQEAGNRRERALAYAFTHQGKNSSKSANPMFMDPNNPQWGWSWLERWIAAHPWDLSNDRKSTINIGEDDVKSTMTIKSENNRRHSIAGSSIGDEENITMGSSPSVPSYMAPTKSAKAREYGSAVRKKLNFPPSPGRERRHSGPPKVVAKVKNVAVSVGK